MCRAAAKNPGYLAVISDPEVAASRGKGLSLPTCKSYPGIRCCCSAEWCCLDSDEPCAA